MEENEEEEDHEREQEEDNLPLVTLNLISIC